MNNQHTITFVLVALLACTESGLAAEPPSTPNPTGTASAVKIRYSREKSTYFRLEKMRSGAIKTGESWNVQDFATSLFNPNSEEITVTWKMISDDPHFVFANGQVGTYTKIYHFKPLFGQTDNVYICPSFEAAKPAWPVSAKTNFTGTVEFFGSKPFYLYLLPPTGIGKSTDLVKAYYAAWGSTPKERYYEDGGLRGVWDNDLKQFVIPYTIYWQNEKNWWPAAACSAVTIENSTDQPMTYTITHIPYYGGTYNSKQRGHPLREGVRSVDTAEAREETDHAPGALWLANTTRCILLKGACSFLPVVQRPPNRGPPPS